VQDAPTAFEWAHASWDNASRGIPRCVRVGAQIRLSSATRSATSSASPMAASPSPASTQTGRCSGSGGG
jgi:hypothetical protein